MFRLPSPSLAVSMLALLIALGGAGYSATGGNFILGQTNSATTQTKLLAPIAGASFRVDNTSTAAAATALTLVVKPGRAPLAVNSPVKVANLNADRLDGLDSTLFARSRTIPFNPAAGADSAPIVLPANRAVLVMGVTLTVDHRGVGQATLLRIPGPSGLIAWTGLESPSTSEITSGFSGATGDHIVYIGDVEPGRVDVQVSGPDAIRIHNGSSETRTGNVTLIW